MPKRQSKIAFPTIDNKKESPQKITKLDEKKESSSKAKKCVDETSTSAVTPTSTTSSHAASSISCVAIGDKISLERGWRMQLSKDLNSEYFKKLMKFVEAERAASTRIYPTAQNVFSWSHLTPFNQVKVVILGQDPYHQPGQAHGLAFSVQPPTAPPPSLKNIYKELESDSEIPNFARPNHGDLSCWARQGVLLLNAVLTVRDSKPNSHAHQGWETFTDSCIRCVSQQKENVVFILWGKYAQKKGKIISKTKHCVIETAHPSPLSASNGFFDSKVFSKVNKYLTEHKIAPIDWNQLD